MKNTKLLQMIIAFVLTVCIIAPIGVFAATPSELGTKYLDVDESAWSLVWSDEFDSTSIDQTKWTFTVGGGGFGNKVIRAQSFLQAATPHKAQPLF